jgi:hypothetical protein
MKIRPVGAKLFLAGGRVKDDEANSRFSQFCEKRIKWKLFIFTANSTQDKPDININIV